MAVLYVDYYNKHGEEKTYDFVLRTHVALSVLNALYESFIRDGSDELGKLPQETKEKFWQTGCKYFETLGGLVMGYQNCF